MDDIITPKRTPTSLTYDPPPQRDNNTVEINDRRYEQLGSTSFENQFDNVPSDLVNRFKTSPQLVPLQDYIDNTKRFPYYVLYSSPNPTEQEILYKARFDLSLKDKFSESISLSRQKAIYNIFTPFGISYAKANEGDVLSQPTHPNPVLNITNINYHTNYLSNAGINYG